MKAIIRAIIALSLLLVFIPMSAQAPQETDGKDLVSMSPDTDFQQALGILQVYLMREEGRIFVDLSNSKGEIGLKIDKLHWKAAMISLFAARGLAWEETYNAILINRSDDKKSGGRGSGATGGGIATGTIFAESRDEVLIEVTFFEADRNALSEVGIDWTSLSDGNVNFSANLNSTDQVTEDILSIAVNESWKIGSGTIDLVTLFKVFEANDEGSVISRQQITVTSGEEGQVLDGVEFSIKSVDESGNTTDEFYKAGTIVTVTPNVRQEMSGNKFIELNINTERSSAEPGAISTVVKKSSANTKKILYNGEEAVIGGLTTKETSEVRKGIPFLKDLPWWVFGIRYLTGYNSHQTKSKELLIILKATIIPALQERQEARPRLKDDIERIRTEIPKFEKQVHPPKEEEEE